MATQTTFVPFSVSKTPEERAEYVKANPHKYMPKAQYDSMKDINNKLDLIMNHILAKK
tara:strand:+ start:504 stop:677 length:174 start_codon:yes stop_codon:yes gene_type:complete